VEGARLTANLSQLAGESTAEWINTWDGKRASANVHAEVMKLTKPEAFGKAPAVLLVWRK